MPAGRDVHYPHARANLRAEGIAYGGTRGLLHDLKPVAPQPPNEPVCVSSIDEKSTFGGPSTDEGRVMLIESAVRAFGQELELNDRRSTPEQDID